MNDPHEMQDVVASSRSGHKMWEKRGFGRWILSFLWLALCGWLFFELSWRQNPALLVPNGPAFTDADCYSRMTRAGMLGGYERFAGLADMAGGGAGIFLSDHRFENYPEGTRPHTTAPFDWLILAGHWMLGGGEDALFRSGFWVSVWLGMLLLAAVWWWSESLRLPFRHGMLLLLATSPILLHGFAAGRPDHHSAVILLCGCALLAEVLRWNFPKSRWWVAAGIFWGLSLWVSWFEPLVLFLFASGFRALSRLRSLGEAEKEPMESMGAMLGGIGIAVGIGVLAVLLEGFPVPDLSPEYRDDFLRWSRTIGELQTGAPLLSLPGWMGWLGLACPILLALVAWKQRGAIPLFWLSLFALLFALTAWHARWSYFLVLAAVLALPWALGFFRRKWLAWGVFVISLWPLAAEWERVLFPDGENAALLQVARIENRDLIEAGNALNALREQGADGAILAPWWKTPALVFQSGLPGVAGSSHQSLPGILDSARFFLTEDAAEAEALLRERGVHFVVVGSPENLLENSSAILGRPATGIPLATILARSPSQAPNFLIPVFQNQTFRVYRVSGNEF